MADAADFRRIALSFEGAGEYPHFDRRAFKARVTFATLAPDELSANIKFAPDEQALKCAVAPDAFAALDNAWGRRGWTCATLAALSEAELKAALEPRGAEGENAQATLSRVASGGTRLPPHAGLVLRRREAASKDESKRPSWLDHPSRRPLCGLLRMRS